MHYLLFISLLFVYSSSSLWAQDYLIKSPLKDRDKTAKTHTLFNYDSTGFYALRFDKHLSYAELEHYDTLLNFKKAYVVTKKSRKYIGVVNIASKMYLLYFRYVENRRENTHDKVSLYAKQLDPDSFALVQDSVELIKPFKMTSNYYRGNFAVSPDRSKILVYDYEEEGDIDDVSGLTNEITVRVFDSTFKLLWKRKVNLSPDGGAKRTVSIKKLRINNQGEVAILTDIFRDTRSYSLRKVTADPTLFFVGREKNNFALFKPNLGNFYFNQINFTFDTEGNILWFGFYSKQKYFQQRGIFFIKINKDRTKILVKKRHEFTREQIAQLLNRKQVNDKAEARSYKLVHWRLTPTGGLVLSAEQQPSTSYNFRSNDILALRLDSEGEIQWFRHVYKSGEQARKQKVFLSHYLFTRGDNAYLLFNKGLYSDGYASAVKISLDGTQMQRKFYSYQNQQELFCPLLSFRLKSPQVFICLQDRFFSSYRFALLDIEKLFRPKSK
ncbi:hypothetical protein [Aureispira anguillae]|uniref:Uncharacterized protein n=1 Tax=Aureispira anguillae TaxID=2864201 RepID=A0A915YKR4_9BACT|nr:hypothetical protein [Aureispira anguillae]BDS14752.1 hypothetical protein AsAng_0055340 [Aureispira anguillae]